MSSETSLPACGFSRPYPTDLTCYIVCPRWLGGCRWILLTGSAPRAHARPSVTFETLRPVALTIRDWDVREIFATRDDDDPLRFAMVPGLRRPWRRSPG